jgi:hypothetical protein
MDQESMEYFLELMLEICNRLGEAQQAGCQNRLRTAKAFVKRARILLKEVYELLDFAIDLSEEE